MVVNATWHFVGDLGMPRAEGTGRDDDQCVAIVGNAADQT
jgi:hypothetical protein